jgi:dienelactone hydrolase
MFKYFPDNYKWSLAAGLLFNSIAAGGAEIGEIHLAGQRLLDASRRDDTDAWLREWTALATRIEALAADALRRGDAVNARETYLRACSYYQAADRLSPHTDPRKIPAYVNSLRCFEAARPLMAPAGERVEIPYADTALPAYYFPPARRERERTPVVVFFDGLDVTKEICYFLAGRQMLEHGLGCLLVDGPGNGESLRLRKLPLRYDWEVPAGAAIDYLETRPDVDAARVGILALSLGGYYVPRAAAMEPRFRAAVAWGAQWDYHRIWLGRRQLAVNSPVSVNQEHVQWVLGVDSFDAALAKLENFKLEGVAQRITCPFLVVHGARDQQIPLSDAQALYAAAASADKRLVVLDEEDMGDQHCQIDNIRMAHYHILGWLREKLAEH